MWNPFKKANPGAKAESATANKETYQPKPPLPYFEWGTNDRSFGISEHFNEHMDIRDAQKDVKANPNSAERQETLADLLMSQTRHWGHAKAGFTFESDSLFRAISEAISLTPSDQTVELLRRESKLAMFYEKRYELRGNLDDLQPGLSLAERVVDRTPDSDPTKPFRLMCLTNLLSHEFSRTGNPNDAHSAVKYAARAVELGEELEGCDDNSVAHLRRNLSVQLEMRSNRNGSLSDLEGAIQQTEQALELLTTSSSDRLPYIGEVGNMRVRKFQKSRDPSDLRSGISAMERAASGIPKRDAAQPRLLDNLANGYHERFKLTRDMKDLELAVEKVEAAHKAQFILDRNHPQMGRYTSSVVRMYTVRVQESKRLFHEGAMVTFARRAMKGLEAGHPGLAEVIEALADGMALDFHREARIRPEVREEFNRLQRYPQQSESGIQRVDIRRINQQRYVQMQLVETPSKNMNNAEVYYRQAAHLENAHPFTRIRVCKKLGDLRLKNRNWDEAADAYELAISLWPRLNPRTLAREDMEYVISQLSGLGPLAANCICYSETRKSSEALQALESGRGIIASLTIEVSDLKTEHAELYNRYTELCYAISSPLKPVSHGGSRTSIAASISQRNQQVDDLKMLEREIRALPGFERFPHARSTNEFTKLARHGPIVCFSTTGDVTNAFIVTHSRVGVLHLKGIEHDDLQEHVKLLVRGKSPTSVATSKRAENNKRVRATLQWLWDFAVRPVLDALGLINEVPPKRLPRIWWVTSGLLGLLPLHAAGSDWGTSVENTMSHVVSSYIPTLKALAYARKKQPRPLGDPHTELLILSVPEKKGYKTLKVKPEIDGVIKNFRPDTVKSSVLSMPSRKEALEKLKSANIAHFICHGISEATSPSQSGLELGDARLTIQDLGQLSLDQVQIAYLSACSTAQNKNSEIVDESIAVASAFSLVGFPHVIGTLWEASDKIAGKIAPRFYKMLMDKIQEGFSENDAVAHAMHQATVSLWTDKKNGQGRVDEWVPFIRIGA